MIREKTNPCFTKDNSQFSAFLYLISTFSSENAIKKIQSAEHN